MKFETKMSEEIFKSKYMWNNDKSPDDAVERVVEVMRSHYPDNVDFLRDAINNKWIGLAGGLWRSAKNEKKNVSAINCTTLAQPEDNLEGLSEAWYWWAKFAAFGQGEGVDLSKIRPVGAKLHNSARESTGVVSFMYVFDTVLNVIAQQGRRGASLISLNIEHPDILDFITCKDEAGILESANISIQITDKFFQAVINDEEWEFKFENKYETISNKVNASRLFEFIAEHVWKSGDPGLQYMDTVKKYSNSDYLGHPVVSTNACSEQWLDPHNVCLLSSINLAKFDEFGRIEGFKKLVELMIITLDAFRLEEVKEGRTPSKLQEEKLLKLPRIGLGVTGLADFFINEKVVYGSNESMKLADELFMVLAVQSYESSYQLAKTVGSSFEYYDKEKYSESAFIKHLKPFLSRDCLDFQAHVCKNTIAPNGTLTEIVEAGGGGVEPIFAKYFVRRERSTTGDWKEWFVFNHAVRRALEEKGVEVTKENVDKYLTEDYWITAHEVLSEDKLKLMSVIQKWIDSSISVTYNLPEEATPEDIQKIYLEAWRMSLKNVSIFREGCKEGVLITDHNYESTKQESKKEVEQPTTEDITVENKERLTPKRPQSLSCDIHKLGEYLVLVGKDVHNDPFEVFMINLPEDYNKEKEGSISKTTKRNYSFKYGDKVIKSLNKYIPESYGTLARFISMSLRHRVPLQFIVDQLSKDKEFSNFEKKVSRVLKKYIKEDSQVLTEGDCESCGGSLIYKEGCRTCPFCGWSKCE